MAKKKTAEYRTIDRMIDDRWYDVDEYMNEHHFLETLDGQGRYSLMENGRCYPIVEVEQGNYPAKLQYTILD